jgi:protein phosphatase
VPPASDTDLPGPVWARDEPRIAGATDVGVVRRINQDAFGRFDDDDRREILLVVADGLGGHQGGEVASQMAVDLIGRHMQESEGEAAERLTRAIQDANAAIFEAAREDEALSGMGTTVVCLLLCEDGRSHIAHVGDSRLYRLRTGSIRSMTDDHSLVATLVREGVLTPEEAQEDPRRNQILRALGVQEELEVELGTLDLEPGDVYVLCSDGLHGMIEDHEIHRIGRRSIRPEAVAEELISAANAAGGADNVTCIVAQIPEPMPIDTIRSTLDRLIRPLRGLLGRRPGT